MVDKLKALLEGIDLTKILPELDSVLGKVYPTLRFLMLLAPFCLLILGLAYFFFAPREANRFFGYRCFYGMGSPEAWQVTQRIAGVVWAVLGAVLLIVMTIISSGMGGMATDAAVIKSLNCILWELGLVILSCVGVDITMAVLYDRHGVRRKK